MYRELFDGGDRDARTHSARQLCRRTRADSEPPPECVGPGARRFSGHRLHSAGVPPGASSRCRRWRTRRSVKPRAVGRVAAAWESSDAVPGDVIRRALPGDPGARSRRDRLGWAPRRYRGREGAGARRPAPHRSSDHRLGRPPGGLPVGRQRRDGGRDRDALDHLASAQAHPRGRRARGRHRDAGTGLSPGRPRGGDGRLPARTPGGRRAHTAGPPTARTSACGCSPRPRSSGADRPTARSATNRSPGPRRAAWRNCGCRRPRPGWTPS